MRIERRFLILLIVFTLALGGCQVKIPENVESEELTIATLKILDTVRKDIENKKLTYDVIEDVGLYNEDNLLSQLPSYEELTTQKEKDIRRKIENVLTLNAMYIKFTPTDKLKDNGQINTENPIGLDLYNNIKELAILLEIKIE